MDIVCPHCQSELEVEPEDVDSAGMAKCISCNLYFNVPMRSESSEAQIALPQKHSGAFLCGLIYGALFMAGILVVVNLFLSEQKRMSSSNGTLYERECAKIDFNRLERISDSVKFCHFSYFPASATPKRNSEYELRDLYGSFKILCKVEENTYICMCVYDNSYKSQPLMIITNRDYADGAYLDSGWYVFVGNRSYETMNGTLKSVRCFVQHP